MPAVSADPLIALYLEAFEATRGRPDLRDQLVDGIVEILTPYARGLKASA